MDGWYGFVFVCVLMGICGSKMEELIEFSESFFDGVGIFALIDLKKVVRVGYLGLKVQERFSFHWFLCHT